MKIAFEAEWHRGRPLAETLPLVERIRKALPAVNKIWAFNPFGVLRRHMRQLNAWETAAYTGLLQGRFTMETPSVIHFALYIRDIEKTTLTQCYVSLFSQISRYWTDGNDDRGACRLLVFASSCIHNAPVSMPAATCRGQNLMF